MGATSDPEAVAVDRYREKFDDSPPYWAINMPGVTERLEAAIKSGNKLKDDVVSKNLKA